MRIIFTEISEDAFGKLAPAPVLIGIHSKINARLYREPHGAYVIVNPHFNSSETACIGVVIPGDVSFFMEEESAKPDRHIFSSGPIGPLSLNLPAAHTDGGEWIYYIAENQIEAFFAFDFDLSKQPLAPSHPHGGVDHANCA